MVLRNVCRLGRLVAVRSALLVLAALSIGGCAMRGDGGLFPFIVGVAPDEPIVFGAKPEESASREEVEAPEAPAKVYAEPMAPPAAEAAGSIPAAPPPDAVPPATEQPQAPAATAPAPQPRASLEDFPEVTSKPMLIQKLRELKKLQEAGRVSIQDYYRLRTQVITEEMPPGVGKGAP